MPLRPLDRLDANKALCIAGESRERLCKHGARLGTWTAHQCQRELYGLFRFFCFPPHSLHRAELPGHRQFSRGGIPNPRSLFPGSGSDQQPHLAPGSQRAVRDSRNGVSRNEERNPRRKSDVLHLENALFRQHSVHPGRFVENPGNRDSTYVVQDLQHALLDAGDAAELMHNTIDPHGPDRGPSCHPKHILPQHSPQRPGQWRRRD